MIRWLMNRMVARFEGEWNYDAAYLREMIATDPRAAMAFARVIGTGRLPQGRTAGGLACGRDRGHPGGGQRPLHAACHRPGDARGRGAGGPEGDRRQKH